MASISRNKILYDECTFHVTWQCHNHSFYFKNNKLKELYYNLLLKFKKQYNILVYSYCIMDSHFHMSGTCKKAKDVSDFFRVVNSLFARAYNKLYKSRGQVCMDRFKSPVIESDLHLLRVMKYIDLNPVRAKIVSNPKQYKYSSYNHYAYGAYDPLITDSPAYLNLGDNEIDRQLIYRDMVDEILKNTTVKMKKENFSTTLFIGDPKWVIENYKRVNIRIKNKNSS